MKTVLVTGANGHLGYSLVKLLKEKGYSVKASVRDLNDPKKTAALKQLGVELVYADLMNKPSLLEALKGVDGLFQVAAAFNLTSDHPEEEVIRPNVEGTKNIIEAAYTCGVKKIVYTSSIAAVGAVKKGEAPLNETHWNERGIEPYAISKTKSEKLAWELAKQYGISLVTILPGTMIGPDFTEPTDSLVLIRDILQGKLPMAPKMSFSYVDVRDVALAHIAAYENDSASGRYIATGDTHSVLELAQMIKKIRPKTKAPKGESPSFLVRMMPFFDYLQHKITGSERTLKKEILQEYLEKIQVYDSNRLKNEFQWKRRPLENSLRETVDWMLPLPV
ncbi:epimerase [Leptospira tipperaryensis]|uniref:Epimerase n=1 Tax=Leptospira tipperaryensis TaxID=2564040 RepID=A0A1D7UU18_9LEPT|nr:NAD-dependent epimerase/dehydratase family protein [Leptospira tipperaryensis]AOP33112.1 epimerase [Leptospira tipperaryensis]